MGQRMEEFRDQAEELVRDMLEAGLTPSEIRPILIDALVAETSE